MSNIDPYQLYFLHTMALMANKRIKNAAFFEIVQRERISSVKTNGQIPSCSIFSKTSVAFSYQLFVWIFRIFQCNTFWGNLLSLVKVIKLWPLNELMQRKWNVIVDVAWILHSPHLLLNAFIAKCWVHKKFKAHTYRPSKWKINFDSEKWKYLRTYFEY